MTQDLRLTCVVGAWTTALIVQLVLPPSLAQQVPDHAPPQTQTAPLGTASFTPPPGQDKQPLSPTSFVTRAAVTNMAEVELGELALTHSADPGVKSFARQMINDHTATNEKLKIVAADQKIALPATVDEEHKTLKKQLSILEGSAFDAQYVKAMVKGHDAAIGLFETASQSPKLPSALQGFAAQTLPILIEHRDAAHSLLGKPAG